LLKSVCLFAYSANPISGTTSASNVNFPAQLIHQDYKGSAFDVSQPEQALFYVTKDILCIIKRVGRKDDIASGESVFRRIEQTEDDLYIGFDEFYSNAVR
jgi:hypothetical protein